MVAQVGHDDPVALSQASGNALPVHQGAEQAVEKDNRSARILFTKFAIVEFQDWLGPCGGSIWFLWQIVGLKPDLQPPV